MKITLLMNEHSYVGREYIAALRKANIRFDILVFDVGNDEVDLFEDQRCGGFWNPPSFTDVSKGLKIYHFEGLKDPKLLAHLANFQYDIGLQGGVGILKANVTEKFSKGILNFHPGKLPFFRGCTTPEWQLVEEQDVIATCHLIDDGIDSGDILAYKLLDLDFSKYEKMRASIYPQMSLFLVEVVENIITKDVFTLTQQDEEKARYFKPIPDEELLMLKNRFPISFN